MLSHTDAEYEAWVRQEYPHVMWLYDVLTKPEYGIEWNGEPANVPPWAERLYAEVPPAGRPRGWRALVVYSGQALRFDYPTDPSQPNVKPRLEAVQLAAAVAGFEAKFPETANGDNVPVAKVSSATAPQGGNVPEVLFSKSGADKNGAAENGGAGGSASAVTGKRLPLPALTWAERGEKVLAMSTELAPPARTGHVVAAASASNAAPVPSGYFAAVSARSDTTQTILRYAAVSDLVVGTPAATSLSREAQALLRHLAPLGQDGSTYPLLHDNAAQQHARVASFRPAWAAGRLGHSERRIVLVRGAADYRYGVPVSWCPRVSELLPSAPLPMDKS